MAELTSRMRMLRALDLQEVDHVPNCFMSFTALRQRCNEDLFRLTEAELGLGLDSMLFIPTLPRPQRPEHPHLRGLPVRFDPAVRVTESRSTSPAGYDILHRRYETPAGELICSVQTSEDWPHGSHVPFIDDYQVPRSIKPLITGAQDLDALQFLLASPRKEDIVEFQKEAQIAHQFVDEHKVLLAGGWGVAADMAFWLCGIQSFVQAMLQERDYARRLLEMIHVWNMERMRVVLSAPVDLYIRRAWYEGCDFITPRTYRDIILPYLKTEVDLAHERGAKFGYICTSGINPMLGLFQEAGIDVLIGIDPVQGSYTDMSLIKEKVGAKMCLWGGVSGAITIERGTEQEIRQATSEAISTLGPLGHVLSPIDNLTVDEPQTWRNLDIFIDEWRRHW
jgi:uroporphyrinogen-III decarboxylase